MDKAERARLRLIKKEVSPAKIYEISLAAISATEWAASVALTNGMDRRFRCTRGQLFDEAHIGDARV